MVTTASFVHHAKIPHGDGKKRTVVDMVQGIIIERMEGIRSLLIAGTK
jgi:hypothetical protein